MTKTKKQIKIIFVIIGLALLPVQVYAEKTMWNSKDFDIYLSDSWTVSTHKGFQTASIGKCEICLYFNPQKITSKNIVNADILATKKLKESFANLNITFEDSTFDTGSLNTIDYWATKGQGELSEEKIYIEIILLSPHNSEDYYLLFYYATNMGYILYKDEISILLNTIKAKPHVSQD